MKSFDDLIHEYHMSKITFQRRMKLIPDFKKKYCKRGKYNKLLISDKGVKLITYEKHDSTSRNFHTRHGSSSNTLTKQDLIDTVHQLLTLNYRQAKMIKANKVGYQRQARHYLADNGLPDKHTWNYHKKIEKLLRQQLSLVKQNDYRHMSFMDKLKHLF